MGIRSVEDDDAKLKTLKLDLNVSRVRNSSYVLL